MSIVDGFTIVELVIATAIFSLVLLGALAGFLRTGNTFYKGVSITQTQAVAKQALDDVAANVADSKSVSAPNQDPASGYTYYCIGDVRYTYTNKVVSTSNTNYNTPGSGGNYGLLKTAVSSCPVPTASSLSGSSTTELLSDNMRLSEFLVCPASGSSNLYNVNLVVAYGNNSSLNVPDSSEPTCANPSFTAPSCSGSTQNQQFCAVSNLSTSVYAGLSL